MNYRELLSHMTQKTGSIVCLGLDPDIDKIPVKDSDIRNKIYIFFESILNEIIKRNIFPATVKPNYAFYAQYGFDGLHALKDTIALFKKNGIPVILDAKRGDIGTTSLAYAREAFDFFDADAVTLSPYMGLDSISPFGEKYPEKGYYVLCRTSNKSAVDFQDINCDGNPLYVHVARKITEWPYSGLGAVTGATYPRDIENILEVFREKGKLLPLLIPGIGTQGGDLNALISVLVKYGRCDLHRINSSSGILYAYLKTNTLYQTAAVNELRELNNRINEYIQ
jgi:orotidine-5'-phosphate decarboxylase